MSILRNVDSLFNIFSCIWGAWAFFTVIYIAFWMAILALLFFSTDAIEYRSFTSTTKALLLISMWAYITELILSIHNLFLNTYYRLLQLNRQIYIDIGSSFRFSICTIIFEILIVCCEWVFILLIFSLFLFMTSIPARKSLIHIRTSLPFLLRLSGRILLIILFLLHLIYQNLISLTL